MKSEIEIRRRRKIWIAALALALLAIVFAFAADASVVSWMHSHSSVTLKHAADLASRIGDWPAHAALGFLGGIVAYTAGRKDWFRIFLAMLVACALAGIAARVIKIATGRARPSVNTEAAWKGPRLSAKYNAFPSGHTASSTAFFVTLFIARKRLGAPFLAIPVLIAAARILAGAHYLSDVTFAAALGIVCAILTCNAIGCQRRDTS